MEVAQAGLPAGPMPDAEGAEHLIFASEDRHWRIALSLLQAAEAWGEGIQTPTPVMRVAMPAVKATAPLDKEEMEERKIPVVPEARHGLDPETTAMAVALA